MKQGLQGGLRHLRHHTRPGFGPLSSRPHAFRHRPPARRRLLPLISVSGGAGPSGSGPRSSCRPWRRISGSSSTSGSPDCAASSCQRVRPTVGSDFGLVTTPSASQQWQQLAPVLQRKVDPPSASPSAFAAIRPLPYSARSPQVTALPSGRFPSTTGWRLGCTADLAGRSARRWHRGAASTARPAFRAAPRSGPGLAPHPVPQARSRAARPSALRCASSQIGQCGPA